MGFGGFVVRSTLLAAAGGALYLGVLNPVMNRIGESNAVVEQGYVNPKSLSVQGKKNPAGNIETYLNYKSGEDTLSLPVQKGPNGPLVGSIDYWWSSIGQDDRTGLVVSEWPSVDSQIKRGIVGSELDAMLNSFYGSQSQKQSPAPQLPQQYNAQPTRK